MRPPATSAASPCVFTARKRPVLKFWVGVSTFLPGGGAEWAYEDNPLEKVYYVLEGEMTVTDKDGKKYVIHKNESISFPPNEGRGLKNESNLPARMLVIINYPNA